MKQLETFIRKSQSVVNEFDRWATEVQPVAHVDHMCYKCGDSGEFEDVRRLCESNSQYIYQSIISDRRIAVVKFLEPIKTALGEIWFLELSDQKPDKSQASGFNHIEIYPTAGSVEELVAQLEAKGEILHKVVRPHHTTYDLELDSGFIVRLEPEPIVEKIKQEEM